jgi:hypothetical protein
MEKSSQKTDEPLKLGRPVDEDMVPDASGRMRPCIVGLASVASTTKGTRADRPL